MNKKDTLIYLVYLVASGLAIGLIIHFQNIFK